MVITTYKGMVIPCQLLKVLYLALLILMTRNFFKSHTNIFSYVSDEWMPGETYMSNVHSELIRFPHSSLVGF